MNGHHRPFLALWVLAVAASVAAFVVHLALRGRTMALGYELGKVRAEQARLREVKRVLELEVASYETPQRVEMVARTILRMEPPSADRIIAMAPPAGTSATHEDADLSSLKPVAVDPKARPSASSAPAGSAPPAATELVGPRVTPPKTAACIEDAP